jgi:hypothetical protein
MARRQRVHYPGGLYHVIARGNRGHKVFRRAQDYRVYLKFLGEYTDPTLFEELLYFLKLHNFMSNCKMVKKYNELDFIF